MDVRYRAATADDLPAAADLYLESVSDLWSRHGIVGALPSREVAVATFRHVHATGIFDVAEADGRLVGVASAVVREPLWFLSTFWVRPGSQGRGIGGPLLDRVWAAGRAAGATTFFTYSSIDATAMAAYLRRGLLPGWQILTFAGRPGRLPEVAEGVRETPLDVGTASSVDADVRATRRVVDHAWWLRDHGPFRGRAVTCDGELAGYFYATRGYAGPAAWTAPEHAGAVLGLAVRIACELAPEVKLIVPGVNHDAIRFATAAGLRLTGFSHFLTTAPFGRMDRYVASGPALF